MTDARNADSRRVIYLCHVCGQRWRWLPDSLQIDVSINGVAVEPRCPSCCYPLSEPGAHFSPNTRSGAGQ